MTAAQIVLAAFALVLLLVFSPWLNHLEGHLPAARGRFFLNLVGAALLIGAML